MNLGSFAGAELGELTLADMLADLGPQEGKLSKAQKQLKQLARKAQAVEAPLPGPIRARKERQAGWASLHVEICSCRGKSFEAF